MTNKLANVFIWAFPHNNTLSDGSFCTWKRFRQYDHLKVCKGDLPPYVQYCNMPYWPAKLNSFFQMLYSSHALYTSYLFAGNKLHQHTFTVYSTTLQLHRQSTSVAYRFVIHNHTIWTLLVLKIFTNEALSQQQSFEQNTDGQWKPVGKKHKWYRLRCRT